MKSELTQNMQDRQTQVRAGPARAVGRLRETDGMVICRNDAVAAATTDQGIPNVKSCQKSGPMP